MSFGGVPAVFADVGLDVVDCDSRPQPDSITPATTALANPSARRELSERNALLLNPAVEED